MEIGISQSTSSAQVPGAAVALTPSLRHALTTSAPPGQAPTAHRRHAADLLGLAIFLLLLGLYLVVW